MLQEGLPQLAEGLQQLELAISLKQMQLNSLKAMLSMAQGSLIPNDSLVAELEAQVAAAQAELDGLNAQKTELETMQTEYTAQLEQLQIQKQELQTQRKELVATQRTLTDAMGALEDGMLEINSQQVQAENQFAAAEAELESAKIQLDTAQEQLTAAVEQAQAGMTELNKAQTELDGAFAEYEAGKMEAEQELAKAEAELADAHDKLMEGREAIDSMAAAEVFVLDRNSNAGYLALDSNSDIVAGVSRVFPAFFLLVAALVCITTMTRMVEEERTQIGTFKALGYRNGAIISKYLIYAGFAAVVGCGLGTVIGSVVFPTILWYVYGLLLHIPTPVVLLMDWQLCLAVVAAYTAVMLLVTWYCCRRSLREVPAELIRPRAPTSGKKIFLEYLFFWNDGLDPAGDGGFYLNVLQNGFGLGDLRFLGLQVQLRFLQIHLGGLDLHGVLQLVGGAHPVALGFQILDLFLVIFNGGNQLLLFQFLLVQSKLELVHVVGEQHIALLHIVAFLHQKLGHGFVGVLLDLGHVFGYHDASEPVTGGNAAHAGQLRHGLDIYGGAVVSAGGHAQHQAQRDRRAQPLCSLHCKIPPWLLRVSFSIASIIRHMPLKINRARFKYSLIFCVRPGKRL